MRLRKVLAVMFALALVVLAMNTTKAEASVIKFDSCKCDWFVWNAEYSQIQVDFYQSGHDLSEIYDCRMTLKIEDMSGGCGGGYILNSEAGGWDQKEWGNAGSDKAITLVDLGDNLYSLSFGSSAPLYTEPGGWAQVVISQWWGPDFEIVKCELIGADGSAIATTPSVAEEAPAEEAPAEEAPAEDVAALPKTGVVSAIVLYAFGACLVAGGAAVVKKNKD